MNVSSQPVVHAVPVPSPTGAYWPSGVGVLLP